MQFTKEQLIEQAKNNLIGLKNYVTVYPERAESEAMNIRLAEIALAALGTDTRENPVLAYADSYRSMAMHGVKSIPILNVITDLERNIAPLYTASPVPVVPDEMYWQGAPVEGSTRAAAYATGWNACRAAMLQAGYYPVTPDNATCKYCGGTGYFRWQQSENMCPCPCVGCDVPAAPQ